MQEGDYRVSVGVMKYLRHLLMGHEIFFKIFDGPENFFHVLYLVILFFKLSYQGDLRKTKRAK